MASPIAQVQAVLDGFSRDLNRAPKVHEAGRGSLSNVRLSGTAIALSTILRLALRHGLDVALALTYESSMQRRRRRQFRLAGRTWKAVSYLVRVLSAGLIDAHASDCVLILRRPVAVGSLRR